MNKIGLKMCNTDKDSSIAYIKEIREITENDIDGIPTKFYEPILSKFVLKKKVKEMIWNAIGEAHAENRLSPFIILIPKKHITRKKIPLEEIPIPFAEHVVYIVPYIRKIIIYETWDDRDDE